MLERPYHQKHCNLSRYRLQVSKVRNRTGSGLTPRRSAAGRRPDRCIGLCTPGMGMCDWKQWRRVRTKVRHLLALGTGKRQAILTALRRKSDRHLSRTLATQTGMTNQWLARQGLPSVRDLWMKAHGDA